MVSDIKSQIIECYRSAQEYSDKGNFEVKISFAKMEGKIAGKFATGYKRSNNTFKMKWSKVSKFHGNDGEEIKTNFHNEVFELKLGDGANLMHKGKEPKRLVATGKSSEMDLSASYDSLLLVKIIPPLLKQDLFVESKINFDYDTDFEIDETDEYYSLKSKNSPIKVSLLADKKLFIKEVRLQIGDWTSFLKQGPLAFAKLNFEPMMHLIEKKIPSTLIGVYKYDQVSISD